jgi:uncharacterized protein (DUF2267 family)
MSTVAAFDKSIQKTNIWIRDALKELQWTEPRRAYLAIKAVLHAIRDRISVQEVAQLGAQLPLLVRGVYYDGWNPSKTPVKDRRKEAFLLQIQHEFESTANRNVDAEHIARSILRILNRHVPGGEIGQIKEMLPHGIRQYWPAA